MTLLLFPLISCDLKLFVRVCKISQFVKFAWR